MNEDLTKHINNIISIEKQIQSINDSILYIEDRLRTFYGTPKEKEDILRNVNHIKILSEKPHIKERLSEQEITNIGDILHKTTDIWWTNNP